MSTKLSEFDNLKPGDKVETKVLRKIEESGKTFIELTRRKEHMKLDEGLDKDLQNLLSLDTLIEGQCVTALITDVVSSDLATKVSCPVQAQISPFVRTQLLFNALFSMDQIKAQANSIGNLVTKTFKAG